MVRFVRRPPYARATVVARARGGRRTTNYTAERPKKSGGKKKLLYLKEKRQRLISQELPDGKDMKCGHMASLPTLISQELPDRKDMGTSDKPNPSPLFYLIQQEKIRKDKRFSDFLFIFAA